MSEDWVPIRCMDCGFEPTPEQVEGVRCCPRCETPGLPVRIADDVTVTINWQELRTLVMWSEFHAGAASEDARWWMSRLVRQIGARLQAQHPGHPVLTFSGEIAQLRADPRFGDVVQNAVVEPEDLSIPPIFDRPEDYTA